MEDLDKVLEEAKHEIVQKAASEAAANPTQDAANPVLDMDAIRQSAEEMIQEAKNEYLKKQASRATATASQDAANPDPGTVAYETRLRDLKRDILRKQASRAAANGIQGAANPAPEHGSVSQNAPSRRAPVRPSELIYDHEDESPEQKMAKRSKYAFQRNGA
jgi:hypothetical protein